MDTVIIKIHGGFRIAKTAYSSFLPELNTRVYADLSPTERGERRSNRPYLRRFVMHPTWREEYLPSIEMFETVVDKKKQVLYILKITFSVPKLLYGNSLREITEADRDVVLRRLQASLRGIGIHVETDKISSAVVGAVHFCKNILLSSDMRMREILKELARVDVSKVEDVTSTEFKHGGQVLNVYSGTIEHCFYEKIADATRPKNKRKDKGHIDDERSFLENYHLQGKEMFRYEYRIKKTQTVKRVINVVLGRDPKSAVVFSDLFAPGLFKAVVLKSWRELIKRPENQLALFGPIDKLGFLSHMLTKAKKVYAKAHSLNKALIAYGLTSAIRDHGAKEVRRTVFSLWNEDHSERFSKKVKAAAELADGLPYSSTISFIDANLERFELINLASLQDGV